jgi:hypothetical protein
VEDVVQLRKVLLLLLGVLVVEVMVVQQPLLQLLGRLIPGVAVALRQTITPHQYQQATAAPASSSSATQAHSAALAAR